jgi:hypothetical protein
MINMSIVIKTRGIAYIVVEDTELIDWGIKRFKGDKTRVGILDYLLTIIHLGDISTVLINKFESYDHTQAIRFASDLEFYLHDKNINLQKVSSLLIKQAFDGAARFEIAERLAEELPNLTHLLPKRKRIWESEDAHMLLFDAASQLRALKMI